MKRDMDLLRNMLLIIEECPDVPPKTMRIETFLDLCDNPAVVSMHLHLLHSSGFIEANAIARNDCIKGIEVQGLTPAGYEYLEVIRSAKIWRNVKEKIATVGGATLDIIKAVATEEVKHVLGL